MRKTFALLVRFCRDETGATMIEYALMVALIALVIIGAVTLVGLSLSGVFADPQLHSALAS